MGDDVKMGEPPDRFAGVGVTAVKNYKAKILQDPQWIFEELPLYTQIDSRKYLCRFWGTYKNCRHFAYQKHGMAQNGAIDTNWSAPPNQNVLKS